MLYLSKISLYGALALFYLGSLTFLFQVGRRSQVQYFNRENPPPRPQGLSSEDVKTVVDLKAENLGLPLKPVDATVVGPVATAWSVYRFIGRHAPMLLRMPTLTANLAYKAAVFLISLYFVTAVTGRRYVPHLPDRLGLLAPSGWLAVGVGVLLTSYVLGRVIGSPQRSFLELRLAYDAVAARQGYWFGNRNDQGHYEQSLPELQRILNGLSRMHTQIDRPVDSEMSQLQAMALFYESALVLATMSRYDEALGSIDNALGLLDVLEDYRDSMPRDERIERAKQLFLKGELALVLGRYSESARALVESREINRRLGRDNLVDETDDRLALVLPAVGHLPLLSSAVCGPAVLVGILRHTPPRKFPVVYSVDFRPDGGLLASGCNDKHVWLWDPSTRRRLRILKGHKGPVVCVAFSPDGQVLATASGDTTVGLWIPATGERIGSLMGHAKPVLGVTFDPTGTLIATASGDGSAGLWNAMTRTRFRSLSTDTTAVTAVSFSRDGSLLATAGANGTATIWTIPDGKPVLTLSGHTSGIQDVAFSRTDNLVATAGKDKTVRLWDSSNGHCLRTLEGHRSVVSGVAFSPDGELLASASADKTIRLWNPSTGEHLRTLMGHTGWVFRVAFSPNCEFLASAGMDRTVRLWC